MTERLREKAALESIHHRECYFRPEFILAK